MSRGNETKQEEQKDKNDPIDQLLNGESKNKDIDLGALSVLAGQSTIPPVLEEEFPDFGSKNGLSSSVIDIGALRVEVEKAEAREETAQAESGRLKGQLSVPSSGSLPNNQRVSKSRFGVNIAFGLLLVAVIILGYRAGAPYLDKPDPELPDPEISAPVASAGVRARVSLEQPSNSIPENSANQEIEKDETKGERSPDEENNGEEIAVEDEITTEEEHNDTAVVEEGNQVETVLTSGRTYRRRWNRRRGRRTPVKAADQNMQDSSAQATAEQTKSAGEKQTERAQTGPEPTPAKASGTSELDVLLAGATRPVGASAAKNATSRAAQEVVTAGNSKKQDGISPQPSRSQVRRAMASVMGRVMACRNHVNTTTRVNVSLTVSSSGSIQSARVNGGSAALQQCVSGAVRQARFPRFSNPVFSVTYPFVLAPAE